MKSKSRFHRRKSPREKGTMLVSERPRGKPPDSLTRRTHVDKPLRESEALFDRMLDGVYRSTHEGRFVDVNPAFVKMFGYSSKQEMLAITDIKKELYFSPEERGSHLLDTGQEEVEAYRMRRKDGSEIWVEDHGHYVHDKQGNIIYHEGILRDITERKQFEKSLFALNRHALQLNSATNMEEIIEHTLDAMQLALGFDFGDVLIIEDESLRIKGSRGKAPTVSQLPLNGRGLCALAANKKLTIRVSDTSKENAYVDRMGFDWRGRPTMLSELAVPVIVGDDVAAVLNVESERLDAFKYEEEELLETLASYVASAISRLRRDESLLESVSLHRATLESTAEGILVVDMTGKVSAFNQSFAELWRIPASLLETRDNAKLIQFVADQLEDPRKYLGRIREIYSKPEKESFDVLRFKDGREFERYSQPQRLGARIVGRVYSFRDVTERSRVEEKLRQSVELYQSLFDRMLDGMYRSTHEGRFVDVSAAFVKMFGYRNKQEMLDIGDIKKELYFAAEERGSHILDTGQEEVEVYRMRRRDGSEIWVEDHGRYVHDEQGNIIFHEGILRDVTERRRAEEALRRRADELAALQATVLDMTDASYDLPTLLEVIVKRAVSLLDAKSGGLDLCDSEKREVRCVVSYNTPQDFRGLVLKYGEGSSGLVAETRKPLIIDDYRKWKGAASISGAQELGAEISVPMIWRGQVTGVIQVTEDSAIRQFTQSDVDLLMLFANHAAIAVENTRVEGALRRRAEELVALQATVLDITSLPGDLQKLLEAIVERAARLLGALSGGFYLCDPQRREARCVVSYNTRRDFRGVVLKYGDGAAGRVAETAKPVIINDYRKWEGRAGVYEKDKPFGAVLSAPTIWQGEVTGVIHLMEESTVRSFTEEDLELLMLFANHAAIAIENERRAEGLEQIVAERTKELIEAQDRLLKAERLAAIGETAAMVGHDLRNPLQAISAGTYVLKKEMSSTAGEKTREMLEVIEDSVAYSDRIVRDLLEYSQDLELELTEATPKLIATDAIRQVEIPKNIVISDLTSDEPEIRVDSTKIRRVFVNLIEDAVDAMPDGGKLTIESNISDNFLVLRFADTGPGIPEAILHDLWKPLVTTKPKGIGLGLAICKRIAEAHGGSITVQSKVGEGTTFTLRLPLSHSQQRSP